jgi:hypothetical protein
MPENLERVRAALEQSPSLRKASCENFANVTPIIGQIVGGFEVPSLQNVDGSGVQGN